MGLTLQRQKLRLHLATPMETTGGGFSRIPAPACLFSTPLTTGGLRLTCSVYFSGTFLRTNGNLAPKDKLYAFPKHLLCNYEPLCSVASRYKLPLSSEGRCLAWTCRGDFKNELRSFLRQSHPPAAPRNRKHFITQINSSPLFHRR